MLEYPPGRDERRLARGMAGHGRGIAWVTPEAAHLLAARLAVRRRALVVLIVCMVAGSAVMIGAPNTGRSWSRNGQPASMAAFVTASAVIALGSVMWLAAIRHGEARLARRLPRRVAGNQRLALFAVLGACRTTSIVVAVALNLITWMIFALTGTDQSMLAAYGAAVVLVVGCSAVSVRSLATRSRLAVDKVSLKIDERLRSSDSSVTVMPHYLLCAATPPFLLGLGDTLQLLVIVAPAALIALNGLAESREKRRYTDGPAFGVRPVPQ